MKLFHTYNMLYPGKADVIWAAIARGQMMASAQGLNDTDTNAVIEGEILDAL